MKKTRQIVSLITVFSFLLSTMPVYAEGEVINHDNTSVKTEINENANTINKDILDKVRINNKVYDGKNIVDADCSQLNEYLKNTYNSDIYFTAKGYFNQTKVSGDTEVRVIVKDFLLEGKDVDKFDFDNTIQIEKYAKIIKKNIILKPSVSQCYYGQSIPSEVSLTYDDHEITDKITIPDKVGVEANKKDQYEYFSVGTYEYKAINVSSENYSFEVLPTFKVLKYEPECSASGSSADNMYTEDNCTLCAPEGFLISTNKKDFSSDINVKLHETIGNQSGTVEYFVKNNDKKSEEYGAISEVKEYKYSCVCNKPKIESVEVSKKINYQSPINKIFDIGFVSDETIILKARAQGYYKNDQYPSFTLYSAKTGDVITTVKGKPVKESGNSYFECEYELPLPEGELFKDYKIELTASNDAGEGDRTTAVHKDQAVNHLIIDTNAPTISKEDIVIRYVNDYKTANNYGGFFVADGIVSDSETGIAKLKYRWDNYPDYVEYDLRKNNDLKIFTTDKKHIYYEGRQCEKIIKSSDVANDYNFDPIYYTENSVKDKSAHFRILVPYLNSYSVPNGFHTLHIIAYDYAGNPQELSDTFIKEGSRGADNLAPNITYLNIVSSENDKKINVLPSGNYSNENIIVKIKADDKSDSTYISGVKEYSVNCSNAESNKSDYNINDEFNSIFLINGKTLNNATISAIDNGNHAYTNSISAEIKKLFNQNPDGEKPDEYLKDMQSDTFIIEDVPPKATADVSGKSAEYTDGEEKIFWFNSQKQKVDFTFSDDTSGLNNIILKRGQETVKKYDLSSDQDRTMSRECSDDISKLDTGTYTYSADVFDNSGNEYNEPNLIKINIDNEAPEGVISASSPDQKIIKIDDQYWTDSDDQFEFTINGIDEYSGVKKIEVLVNGKEFKFNDNANSYSYTENRSNSQILKISRSELEKQNIKMNEDHTYTVECKVTDFAENTSESTHYTLHVDQSDPSIDSVEVKSINNPSTGKISTENLNIINLLPFGIFSNSTLTFSIKASDIQYDSGIREIKVRFTDSDKTVSEIDADSIRYNKDEDRFEFDVNLTSGIAFDKYMQLTVFDKYGKSSTRFEKVSMNLRDGIETTPAQHEDGEDQVNVIIEDTAPDMYMQLPEPDYTDRDGKAWFSKKRRNAVMSVSDKESGLHNVSVSVNGSKLTKDCEDHKILSPEDVNSILKNIYEYTFYTDAPDPDHTDLPENSEYTLTFNAADNAGNVSDQAITDKNDSTINSYTYYIDDTAPQIESVAFAPVSVDGIDRTETLYQEPEVFMIDNLHYGLFFQSDYDLKVYPSDKNPSSGLKNVSYKLISYSDSSQPQIITEDSADVNDEGYALIHVNKGFKGRIILSAEDNVGNRSDQQYVDAFVSEDVAPELSMTFSNESSLRDADGNELYNEDVSVTVTVTDTQSGLKNCKVNLNSEKTGETGTSEMINISDLMNSGGSLNGWTIEQSDANLVTKISKTYNFSQDDNNIVVRATATDNCNNEISEPVESRKFTIDKTDPVIDVSCSEGYNGSLYYNKDTKAVITLDITERNFDADLIKTEIENTFTGNKPDVVFSSSAADKHRAVLTFSEGDYIFTVSGTDLAGHKAVVNTPYEGVRRFFVDETQPVVDTNFGSFEKDSENENFFNSSKKAKITIREHNFDQNLVNLVVKSKQSGSSHDENNMNDSVNSFVKYSDWKTSQSDPDLHTLEFEIDKDAVYQLVIAPNDKAGNHAVGSGKSSVFEIDTQKPAVTKKNGQMVTGQKNETEFLDIYTQERLKDPLPSIEFDDVNFDHLEYTLVKFVPDGKSNRELGKISSKTINAQIKEKVFTLNDFSKDGTYALEIKAVDKAGNSSVLNKNTYVRMNDKEVLAFIPDSNIENKTGLFSFEYENGEAISKRPENFNDIDIVVMARNESDVKILLRDMNGDEKDTMLSPESEDKTMYGVGVYTYKLKHEFFIDNYQSDTDSELHLTVMNGEERIDLARIHIDNIAPTGDTDKKFRSWHWYPESDCHKVVISDISELLNESACKVYDKGQEIPFEYSEENKTISFTLCKGWHDIGVHLEDHAGNKFDIQQVDNIYVGYFWLWVILGGTLAAGGIAAFIILKKKKNK